MSHTAKVPYTSDAFGAILYDAICEAIAMMGLAEFRKTSFFGSNHRRAGTQAKADSVWLQAA